MVNLSDIKDSDCEKAENAVAAVGALVIGAYDKAREMALKMLAKNKPVEEIEESTGLSKETILAL